MTHTPAREQVAWRRRAAVAAGFGAACMAVICVPGAASATVPSWLAAVNAWWTASGRAPVTENAVWSSGIGVHLTYLARTPASDFTGAYASLHTENPASPYYTAAGAVERSV